MQPMLRVVIVTALVGATLPAAGADPPADQVARSLGEMEWHASVCHLPTSPLEAALDRYTQRIQAGPLEAKHLRQEFLAGREEYERLFGSRMSCENAAREVADIIARTDRDRGR